MIPFSKKASYKIENIDTKHCFVLLFYLSIYEKKKVFLFFVWPIGTPFYFAQVGQKTENF